MGAEISAYAHEPTLQQAQDTLHLALQAAAQRQKLATTGFFQQSHRTCNIEQEIHCLSTITGLPTSGEAVVDSNLIPGARFDTVTSIIEFDGGDITPLEKDALLQLYRSLIQRTHLIHQTLHATCSTDIAVPIGVQPLLPAMSWQQWEVPQAGLRRRYQLLDAATRREYPQGMITITSPENECTFTDTASYMSVMMRCAGTQFHISECNVEEALQAHEVSIFIAPLMTALFGNSPFVGGIDTGMGSTRTALFLQGEPLRAGLPGPAKTLYEYYEQQLLRALPPFWINEDEESALSLSHGTLHTTSRIQVDMAQRTIRNEFRFIDAQSPFRSMQAFLMTLGAIDGLKDYPLSTYEESQYNLQQALCGLSASMRIQGKTTTAQELAVEIMGIVHRTLKKQGLEELYDIFIAPLLYKELLDGRTQAQQLRLQVQQMITEGSSLQQAIVMMMQMLNNEILYL